MFSSYRWLLHCCTTATRAFPGAFRAILQSFPGPRSLICALTTAPRCPDPGRHLLHLNLSIFCIFPDPASSTNVYINGVDILADIAVLRQMVARRLEAAAPPPTSTAVGPTAGPTRLPSSLPSDTAPSSVPPSTVPSPSPTIALRDLPSLVRAGYTLYRLQGRARPPGNDARGWYRDLCAAYRMRPVACDETAPGRPGLFGTANREFDGVGLPYAPTNSAGTGAAGFTCQLNMGIERESGWQHTITFFQTYMVSEFAMSCICATEGGRVLWMSMRALDLLNLLQAL